MAAIGNVQLVTPSATNGERSIVRENVQPLLDEIIHCPPLERPRNECEELSLKHGWPCLLSVLEVIEEEQDLSQSLCGYLCLFITKHIQIDRERAESLRDFFINMRNCENSAQYEQIHSTFAQNHGAFYAEFSALPFGSTTVHRLLEALSSYSSVLGFSLIQIFLPLATQMKESSLLTNFFPDVNSLTLAPWIASFLCLWVAHKHIPAGSARPTYIDMIESSLFKNEFDHFLLRKESWEKAFSSELEAWKDVFLPILRTCPLKICALPPKAFFLLVAEVPIDFELGQECYSLPIKQIVPDILNKILFVGFLFTDVFLKKLDRKDFSTLTALRKLERKINRSSPEVKTYLTDYIQNAFHLSVNELIRFYIALRQLAIEPLAEFRDLLLEQDFTIGSLIANQQQLALIHKLLKNLKIVRNFMQNTVRPFFQGLKAYGESSREFIKASFSGRIAIQITGPSNSQKISPHLLLDMRAASEDTVVMIENLSQLFPLMGFIDRHTTDFLATQQKLLREAIQKDRISHESNYLLLMKELESEAIQNTKSFPQLRRQCLTPSRVEHCDINVSSEEEEEPSEFFVSSPPHVSIQETLRTRLIALYRQDHLNLELFALLSASISSFFPIASQAQVSAIPYLKSSNKAILKEIHGHAELLVQGLHMFSSALMQKEYGELVLIVHQIILDLHVLTEEFLVFLHGQNYHILPSIHSLLELLEELELDLSPSQQAFCKDFDSSLFVTRFWEHTKRSYRGPLPLAFQLMEKAEKFSLGQQASSLDLAFLIQHLFSSSIEAFQLIHKFSFKKSNSSKSFLQALKFARTKLLAQNPTSQPLSNTPYVFHIEALHKAFSEVEKLKNDLAHTKSRSILPPLSSCLAEANHLFLELDMAYGLAQRQQEKNFWMLRPLFLMDKIFEQLYEGITLIQGSPLRIHSLAEYHNKLRDLLKDRFPPELLQHEEAINLGNSYHYPRKFSSSSPWYPDYLKLLDVEEHLVQETPDFNPLFLKIQEELPLFCKSIFIHIELIRSQLLKDPVHTEGT